MKINSIHYLLLSGLLLLLAACEKDTEADNFAPRVTTGTATDIYRVGATLSGSIQQTGTSTSKSYGILFSELQSLAEYTEHPATTGTSDFSIRLTGLTPGTTYYYCAYAHSGYSIAKGEVKSFTTTESNAPIFASISSGEAEVSGCTVSATLLDEGGSEIILSGFCWTKAGEGEPTTDSHVQNVTVTNGSLSAEITGLEPNTEYVVRAYATNSTGVGYSESIRIQTAPTQTPTLSHIHQTEAAGDRNFSIEAQVTDEGTSKVSQVGFCWSTTNQTPTIEDKTVDLTKEYQGVNTSFGWAEGDLPLGTTYYIRAYAINEVGVAYSEVYTYETAAPKTPEISAATQKESTDFTVTLEAQVTDAGTSAVTEAGFCWSAENNEPTIKDSHINLSEQLKGDATTIIYTLKDLKPGTTYYIRSYATNSEGTTYGEVITFTTAEAKTPAVSATTLKDSGNFSTTLEAQVTDAGTSAVTEAGFCWSTENKEPTIKDSHINLSEQLKGDATTIIYTLKDLKPGTTYYIRSYATNSEGTTYGEVITFTTAEAKAPVLSAITQKDATDTTLTVEAQLTDAGTSAVTKAGFCWSESNKEPTAKDSHEEVTTLLDGKNTILTHKLENLKPATTYYIRVYATNGEGTTYSEVFTYTTPYANAGNGNTGIENLPTTEWK